MRAAEKFPEPSGLKRENKIPIFEHREGEVWGPKVVTSAGGRYGEKEELFLSYENDNFMIDGKIVGKDEFIEALGPHRERMEKLDSSLRGILEK